MPFVVVGADKRPVAPTNVYVMRCGSHVKIGVAEDVDKRRRHLQSACPIEIMVAGAREYPSFAEARAAEKRLHALFAQARGYGEWFAVAPEAVLAELMAGAHPDWFR